MAKAITAATHIRTDLTTLRDAAQDPSTHVRWDVRFTSIDYDRGKPSGSPQRFRYETRLGFGLAIEGWGETVESPDARGSALKFGSSDPKSLIREGVGSWLYSERDGGVDFRTVYNYDVRYGVIGRTIDAVFFRPLMRWSVRWSFDRLRIWLEDGITPERTGSLWFAKVAVLWLLGLTWIANGLIPKVLAVRSTEVDLVRESGIYLGSPEQTLFLIGMAEVLAGLWLMSARAERAAVALTTGLMVALATIVVWVDPSSLADPFGGISKNLALLAAAVAVWFLSPVTPKSSRSRGRGNR